MPGTSTTRLVHLPVSRQSVSSNLGTLPTYCTFSSKGFVIIGILSATSFS